eukprot:1455774-Lingulodinium_polyedra.AAC.1
MFSASIAEALVRAFPRMMCVFEGVLGERYMQVNWEPGGTQVVFRLRGKGAGRVWDEFKGGGGRFCVQFGPEPQQRCHV